MGREWIEHLRTQLSNRSARERRVLMAGGMALLVLIAYGGVYEPIREARSKLAGRLPLQRAELRLMHSQVAEIERLRTHGGAAVQGSLEQRVQASAAAFGLGDGFSRYTVVAADRIQLATQPLAVQTWMGWLANLERNGVAVVRCQIVASEQPGLEKLELTLSGDRR